MNACAHASTRLLEHLDRPPRLDASSHSNRRARIDRRPHAHPIASFIRVRSIGAPRRRSSQSGPWSSIIHRSRILPRARAYTSHAYTTVVDVPSRITRARASHRRRHRRQRQRHHRSSRRSINGIRRYTTRSRPHARGGRCGWCMVMTYRTYGL